uniref:phosphatase and actin regulator 2-like isoform X2 n=1 Tax=Pristiophorus japonicus TaxID=55135 RepID=UPI00398F8A3B
MGQTLVSSFTEPASGDGLEKSAVTNSERSPPVSGTPPLKRKSKLASIGKIFKPWKWRKKKASEQFQETSAMLERKISTRQTREELVRRGVLKEIPDQDGNTEVTFRNGSTIHAIPIRVEPVIESTADAGSTDTTTATHQTGTRAVETPGDCHDRKVPPSPEAEPSATPVAQLLDSTAVTAFTAAAKEDSRDKPSPQPAPKYPSVPPKPTNWSLNTEHQSCQFEKLSNMLSPPQSPSQLRSVMTANRSQDASGFPGTGDTLWKSGKHSDLPAQPSALRPSQSDPFGPPLVAQSPSPQPGDLAQEAKAELEKSEAECDQGMDQSGLSRQQNLQKEAPLADPSHVVQSELTGGEMEVSRGQTDTGLTATEETLKGPCDDVDSSVKVVIGVSHFTKKSRVQMDKSSPVIVIPSVAYPETPGSDSDSDSSLQYRNDSDDDDEEDDECLNSALANKIRRRDTLAIKLRNRPTKQELEEKNILPRKSDEERMELRQQIGTKLIRRLSQRPSLEELEQRNILRYRNEEEEHEERLEIRRRLTRKLSLRPTVAELQARRILRFNEYVEVTEAQDYDRRADKPWTRLTPADKAAIRKELNEFKSREMEVHEESRHLTRYVGPGFCLSLSPSSSPSPALCLSPSLSLTLSPSLCLSPSPSRSLSLTLSPALCDSLSLSVSDPLYQTVSHSLSHPLAVSDPLYQDCRSLSVFFTLFLTSASLCLTLPGFLSPSDSVSHPLSISCPLCLTLPLSVRPSLSVITDCLSEFLAVLLFSAAL